MAHSVNLMREENKLLCNLCDYQATKQSNLNTHKLAVHEGVKYPCSMCDYQATAQRSLKRHQQSVHVSSIHAPHVSLKVDLKVILQLMWNQFMKMWSIAAQYVIIKQKQANI